MGTPPAIEEEILEALTSVFLEHGYGGATLSLFTEATGLKRPSLYHRFPGGKLDMALAVAEFSRERFFGDVLGPLLHDDGDPVDRVRATARNMGRVYSQGNASCVLDALALGAKGEDRQVIDKAVRRMFEQFIGTMTKAAKDLGASQGEAKLFGEEAVLRLEGSLVVARATGRPAAFKRTLNHLPDLLSGKFASFE